MHLPPPPDTRELLPPLLACLPTAFISPRPPPALLPLLSPLLRQRLSFLSSGGNSRSDGWLPLLSWNAEVGGKLPDVVERMHLEPHPVSGEVEIEDVRPSKYRRLDAETLHARLELDQFDISPTYLWCETDEHGGLDPGWRLADLRSLEDLDDGTDWFDTISQANDAAPAPVDSPINDATSGNGKAAPAHNGIEDNDNEDDYWAAYDRTPSQTPAQKQSPAPQSLTSFQQSSRRHAEDNYFARYGAEVQPAMDAHDPDEEAAAQQLGQSSLNGTSTIHHPQPLPPQPLEDRPTSRPTGASLYPASNNAFPSFTNNELTAPRPISPTSSHSSIEKLEARARAISDAQIGASEDRAQAAIKQHISTDIKSLFRLSRTTGMDREDFEEIVKKELQCLSLLEMEQDR